MGGLTANEKNLIKIDKKPFTQKNRQGFCAERFLWKPSQPVTHPSLRPKFVNDRGAGLPPMVSLTNWAAVPWRIEGPKRLFRGFCKGWLYYPIIWVFPKIVVKTPKRMVKIMENPIQNGWFGGKTTYFWKPSMWKRGHLYSSDRYVLVLPNGRKIPYEKSTLPKGRLGTGHLETGVLERQVSYLFRQLYP